MKMEDKNNLERFLRQQLQNYEAADNEWNVPPDDVWDNAMNQMSGEKKKRKYRFVWFWILGLFVAGGIGYYVFHKEQQLEHLNEKLIMTNIALENVQKEIDDLKHEQIVDSNRQDESLEKDKTDLKSINPTTKTDSRLHKIIAAPKGHLSPLDSKNKSAKFNSKKKDLKPIATSEIAINQIQILQEKEQITADFRESYAIATIPTLAPLPISYDPSPILRSVSKTPIIQSKRIWLKIQGAPLLLKREVKNSNLPNAGFVNQGLSGFETGIHIGLDLKKRWVIETGVSYFNLNIENERRKRFSFNSNNETLNSDGLFESSVTSENINGLGSSTGELVFVRNSTDFITNGTQITATVGSRSEINHLEIPLILNYKLFNRRIMVNLQAGLVWNYVLHRHSELNDVAVNHPLITFNRGTTSPLNGIKQQTFSYQLGLGIEYRLNKHWSFTLEPIYQKGLEPHIEFKNGTQIFLEKSGVVAGLKYRI